MAEYLAVAAIIAIAIWLGRDIRLAPGAEALPFHEVDAPQQAHLEREAQPHAHDPEPEPEVDIFEKRVSDLVDGDDKSRFHVFECEGEKSLYTIAVRLQTSGTYLCITSAETALEASDILRSLRTIER